MLSAGNEPLFLGRQYLPFAFGANRVDAHDAGLTRLMSKSAIVLRVTAKRRIVANAVDEVPRNVAHPGYLSGAELWLIRELCDNGGPLFSVRSCNGFQMNPHQIKWLSLRIKP